MCSLRGIFNNPPPPLLFIFFFLPVLQVKGAARLAYSASAFAYLREAAEQSHNLLIFLWCLCLCHFLTPQTCMLSFLNTRLQHLLSFPSPPPHQRPLASRSYGLTAVASYDCGDGSVGLIVSCLSSFPVG